MSDQRIFKAEVIEVIDGDTIWVRGCDYGTEVKIRLFDLDCAEKCTRNGLNAKNFVIDLLQKHNNIVYVQYDFSRQVDSYDRRMGYIYLDENGKECLADIIIKHGYGKPYNQ